MSDINLLPKREGLKLENEKLAAVLRKISVVVLSLTALTAMVLFILVVQSPLSKIREKENAMLSDIAKFKIPMSRSIIINERLNSIANILRQRNQFEKYTSAILAVVPASVSLTSLTIDQKTMLLTGSSTSLSAVSTYFDGLVAMQKERNLIQSVVLQSFSSQKDTGKYYFTLKITFL